MSLDADQLRRSVDVETFETDRFPGTDGGVASAPGGVGGGGVGGGGVGGVGGVGGGGAPPVPAQVA